MSRRWIFACLLVVLIQLAWGQSVSYDKSCNPGRPDFPACTSSLTAKSKATSTASSPTTKSTNTLSSPTASPGSTGSNGGNGNPVSTTRSGSGSSASQAGTTNDGASTSSSGMSSAEKLGIGVGVGVGAAVLIAAVALFFFIRRRNRKPYDTSSSPTAQYSSHPAMSSGVPALAGAAAMGRSRSPSAYSPPRTPESTTREAALAPSSATSQQSVPRSPPRLSLPPPTPEEEKLMPEPSGYVADYVPSPMEEHSGAVSPVSPMSPASSRPPSPLRDDEKW